MEGSLWVSDDKASLLEIETGRDASKWEQKLFHHDLLAIYDINTLLERGQARDSVPVPSVIPSVICRH